MFLPARVGTAKEAIVRNLVQRVGGEKAVSQNNEFLLTGWHRNSTWIRTFMQEKCSLQNSSKAESQVLAKKSAWTRYMSDHLADLTEVVVSVMSLRPVCSTAENEWSSWCRDHRETSTWLGENRTRRLFTSQFNWHNEPGCKGDIYDDLELLEEEWDEKQELVDV